MYKKAKHRFLCFWQLCQTSAAELQFFVMIINDLQNGSIKTIICIVSKGQSNGTAKKEIGLVYWQFALYGMPAAFDDLFQAHLKQHDQPNEWSKLWKSLVPHTDDIFMILRKKTLGTTSSSLCPYWLFSWFSDNLRFYFLLCAQISWHMYKMMISSLYPWTKKNSFCF